MSDFTYQTLGLTENVPQLKAGIELLKCNTDIGSIFKDDTILHFLKYVYDFSQANLNEKNRIQIGDFFVENEFHVQLARIDEHLSKICDTLDDESENEEDKRKISILCYTQYATNDLFFFCRNAKIKYFECGATTNLIRYLKNETFVDKFCHGRLFLFILSNINVLSKEADLFKNEWAQLNAVDTLLSISTKNAALKADVYTIIVRIANDRDINNLNQLAEIITLFIKFLNKGAKQMTENSGSLKREKLEFGEDKLSKQYDVLIIFDDENYTGTWSIASIMDVVYRLGINDKIKYDLYVKYNLKEPLRVILLNGSEIEKRYALKILAQLCFDTQVLEIVSKDSEIVNYLNFLSKETYSDTVIFGLCQQIMWSLNIRNKVEKPMSMPSHTLSQNYQIMISYNSISRDLCMKIKDELEKVGYRVWIDINEIHGSSLDSMANAVDSSDVILLCVTENYRQSLNCQAEAQYAFKRKKLIIPLIMQKGYEVVGGWLGMIMGDKIFINFIKHAFDDAVKRLINQIGLVKPNGVLIETTQINNLNSINTSKEKDISEWTEADVEKWFQKEGDMVIYNYLKPCDGKLLTQLHDMQVNAPEFFYQFVSVKNQVDGRALLVFSLNLKELFKNKSVK